MHQKIGDLLKKFEQEYNVYLDANDATFFWIVHVKIPKTHVHPVENYQDHQYVSTPFEQGYVLILENSTQSPTYIVENWGLVTTFEEFVKKVLLRILEEFSDSDYEYRRTQKLVMR